MNAHFSHLALLSAEQMRAAENATIAAGTPGFILMKQAGEKAAHTIMERFSPSPILVLCGPGNNGGDGFILAQTLLEHGWPVNLWASSHELSGDAKEASKMYRGNRIGDITSEPLESYSLIVDALFGTGLTRNIENEFNTVIEDVNNAKAHVIALDIPSGVHTNTGDVMGNAIEANHTITFSHAKPGHFLLPGKNLTGDLITLDIGIELGGISPETYQNTPLLWRNHFPQPHVHSHKYNRGYTLVIGGPITKTGAAKLASRSALRIGSGLVSIACDRESLPIYATSQAAVMTVLIEQESDFTTLLDDERINSVVIGPGAGLTDQTKNRVRNILNAGKHCVLDADALRLFSEHPDMLFKHINGSCILTPHEGEFQHLFNNISVDMEADKLTRACQAAKLSGATIIYKGSDTVIATPEGKAALSSHTASSLATAGTGDVLAGLCGGLLAQGMSAFESAAAASWIHAEAATLFGPGLIAEDLPELIPAVLRDVIFLVN
jgi:NAD(P)H-hydrate epimerase